MSGYKVVETSEKSELQKFASWFHQDWSLIYDSLDRGAEMYIQALPEARRFVLKAELAQFLTSASPKAWLRLGAQIFDRDAGLQAMLQRFLQMMD
jgi:hypothetical protein